MEKLHKPHVIRLGISTVGESSRCLLAKSGALIDTHVRLQALVEFEIAASSGFLCGCCGWCGEAMALQLVELMVSKLR